jgi:hypothetical protein
MQVDVHNTSGLRWALQDTIERASYQRATHCHDFPLSGSERRGRLAQLALQKLMQPALAALLLNMHPPSSTSAQESQKNEEAASMNSDFQRL